MVAARKMIYVVQSTTHNSHAYKITHSANDFVDCMRELSNWILKYARADFPSEKAIKNRKEKILCVQSAYAVYS